MKLMLILSAENISDNIIVGSITIFLQFLNVVKSESLDILGQEIFSFGNSL